MRLRRGFHLSIATAVSLSAACASPTRARPREVPCTGQLFLDVRNSLSVDVDLYSGSPNSQAAVFLGSASPGTSRLAVPSMPGYMYAVTPKGQTINLYPPTTGGVRVSAACEP